MAMRKKGRKDWEEDDNDLAAKPELKRDHSGDVLETDDDQDLDFASIADSVTPRDAEPDARDIDNLTDRIFASVLSRYGWERRGNRIEHVGEERQRNRS